MFIASPWERQTLVILHHSSGPWLRDLGKKHPNGCIGIPDSSSGVILNYFSERDSSVAIPLWIEGSNAGMPLITVVTDQC
jgi:hypothetical protein